MARKARDYKAEERRRNELARLRGHTNRYQQRKKIETGAIAALAPKRVRSTRTKTAQKARVRPPRGAAKITDYEIQGTKISRVQRASDWSAAHASEDIAKYRPERAKSLGVGEAAYTNAYLRAFVEGDTRYQRVRRSGGSVDLYYWFVTLNGYYMAEEYDEKYGPAA